MLTTPELQELAGRVQYRPGWTFSVYQHRFEGQALLIHMSVLDSQTGEPALIPVPTFIPPIPDETYFWSWLLYRLQRLESHEGRECFRVDGRMWSNPHAPHADVEHW